MFYSVVFDMESIQSHENLPRLRNVKSNGTCSGIANNDFFEERGILSVNQFDSGGSLGQQTRWFWCISKGFPKSMQVACPLQVLLTRCRMLEPYINCVYKDLTGIYWSELEFISKTGNWEQLSERGVPLCFLFEVELILFFLILFYHFFMLVAEVCLYVELEVFDGGGSGGGPCSLGSSKKGRVLTNSAVLTGCSHRSSGHRSVGFSEHLKMCRIVCCSNLQHGQLLMPDSPTQCLQLLREWQ